MDTIVSPEEGGALRLSESLLSLEVSEPDDSFLRAVVYQAPPVPMPVLGERLGGQETPR